MSLKPVNFVVSLARSFSSSPAANAGPTKMQRKLDKLHKHWAKDIFKQRTEWVDPILGKPNVPFIERMRAHIVQPNRQISLLDSEETSRLEFLAEEATSVGLEGYKLSEENAQRKREILARVIGMRNSNQSEARKVALDFARSEFERQPGDTASSEVQAAMKTVKIHFLTAHFKAARKDFNAQRELETLVHHRQKDLKYLRRKDPKRYLWTIEKLGLSDDAVMKEFSLNRAYMWKIKFHGDQTRKPRLSVEEMSAQKIYYARKKKAIAYMVGRDPTFAERAIENM